MSGKRLAVLMAIVLLLIVSSILVPSHASAVETSLTTDRSALSSIDGVVMAENGTINYDISGNVTFDVYVMTNDNYARATNNESYAYIDDLSVFNVTSASVRGNLNIGSYLLVVNTHGPGTVIVTDLEFAYPSNGITIPWDTIAMVVVTAVVSVAATYLIMRSRLKKG